MTRMPSLRAWRRDQRGGARARPLRSYRGLISGAIGACFALVAVLGVLQFEWIGQVSESQKQAALALLRGPMRDAMDQFRTETELLLGAFRLEAERDPADRLRTIRHRYLSWHANSNHGPAVKRILFYGTPPSGSRELTELLVEPLAVKSAAWDEELASVRRHIDDLDVNPGREIPRAWVGTWLFLPRAMALYRPVAQLEPAGTDGPPRASLEGYLILELDLGFIRDQLVPEILADEFWRVTRHSRFSLSVELDGENVWVYGPSGPIEGAGGSAEYVLRPSSGPDPTGRADAAVSFPLREESVPEAMARHGAVQRVALRSRIDIARLEQHSRVPAGQESGAGLYGTPGTDGPAGILRRSGHLPRLFVAASKPFTVRLTARREGVSLAAANNRAYRRSVAIGICLLLLLVGAMLTVAVSERNAARQADMRVEAAASQSHQMRNPLAAISILADNMADGAVRSGERIVQYGERIRAYGERLTEIVDRASRVAAMDTPMRPYRLAAVDVSEVAREAFEEARPGIEEAGFAAECAFAEGLPAVRADPQALRQALSDLLGNAVKYGLPGRWVRLETAVAGSDSRPEVQFRVHDRGRGVPAREAKMVFEPFYRAADVANSPIPGSGLGLTLVRNAVEAMGGRLTMESEVGRGSVFTISFPAG